MRLACVQTPAQARGSRSLMIGEGTQSTNQRRHNYVQENVEVGFFTDPTVCIGCKACEVACKEWNRIPDSPKGFSGHSYDNTLDLGANTWRHVAFVEQRKDVGLDASGGGLVQTAALDQLIEQAGLGTYQ